MGFAVQAAQLPGIGMAFFLLQTTKERFHRDQLPPPPKNWKELKAHSHATGFYEGARKEYTDLFKRETFQVVDIPEGKQIIPVKWVFDYKFDSDGYLIKYKARLVVRGDLQIMLYEDTRATTLAARVFRLLMAILAVFDLEAYQLDAINAFVNSLIDEEVYIRFPPGFGRQGLVLRLLRALYGLRRSPRLWQLELGKTLIKLGLKQSNEESCLYSNEHLTVIFFVDDVVIIYHKDKRQQMENFKAKLMELYPMREIGDLKWFLGIRIIRDRAQRKLWMCQDSYIEKIAQRFHLTKAHTPDTPAITTPQSQNDEKASPERILEYQQKVGSALFATTITRPDAARTANKLSEYNLNPGPRHLEAVNRLIGYLYGSRYLAIEFSSQRSSTVFLAASDAAFGDNEDRKSTEGYLMQLFGGPIDWRATKQKTVTTSTTEAELLSVSHASREVLWWNRLFKDIGLDIEHEVAVDCDNKQTVNLLQSKEPILHTKLRHVDIHQHWLRELVQDKKIHINWIPTSRMPADGLTKALPPNNHQKFVNMLGLRDIRDRIEAMGSFNTS
jgi:hypothetical protein